MGELESKDVDTKKEILSLSLTVKSLAEKLQRELGNNDKKTQQET